MWKAIYTSVRGTSHHDGNLPCQDACRVVALQQEAGQVLVVLCSDGAGSATHSERGAELACDHLLALIQRGLEVTGFTAIDRETVIGWLDTVRSRLAEESELLQVPIRELACTVVAAVVAEDEAVFFQIGDGATVIARGEEYASVFWPQSGEFANTTNFLTCETYQSHLEFSRLPERIDEVASFTDGLERLALRFHDQTVHSPFFTPMFRALRQTKDTELLFEPLRAFLESEKVNDRTDDDKTLVLATRRHDAESMV